MTFKPTPWTKTNPDLGEPVTLAGSVAPIAALPSDQRRLQIEEICRIFATPIDQAVAMAAARRRMLDELFAGELQNIKSWIRAIDSHAKTHGQALTKSHKLEGPTR